MSKEYEVAVKLSLKDALTDGLKKISSALKKFSEDADNVKPDPFGEASDSVDKFGKKAGEANTSMQTLKTSMAAVAAAAVFKGAIDSSIDFERQLSIIQSVTFATTEEMRQLSDAAKEYGSTTQFTATQAAEGMEILARAGLS
ncbi:MAG: phage tail tape measure protein, partial [Thiomargarita sp.]|nr:phage tail tape measure protein [Thiomargarita sp.]